MINTEMVDALEMDLLAALEMDLLAARKTGEVVAYVVPFGACCTEAAAVAQALIDRLRRECGLTIKVGTARAQNGLALLIEDVTPA